MSSEYNSDIWPPGTENWDDDGNDDGYFCYNDYDCYDDEGDHNDYYDYDYDSNYDDDTYSYDYHDDDDDHY